MKKTAKLILAGALTFAFMSTGFHNVALAEETSTEPTEIASEVPASEVPESYVPTSEVPESYVPASEVPESYVPASEVPESYVPASEVPESYVPASEVPASYVPASEVPASEVPASVEPSPSVSPSETPSSSDESEEMTKIVVTLRDKDTNEVVADTVIIILDADTLDYAVYGSTDENGQIVAYVPNGTYMVYTLEGFLVADEDDTSGYTIVVAKGGTVNVEVNFIDYDWDDIYEEETEDDLDDAATVEDTTTESTASTTESTTESDTESPKTGEGNMMVVFFGVMAASGLAIVTGKKKKYF